MDEHSPLVEAITLWEEITGVAPPDEAGFWKSGAGMGTWAIRDTYTELKEALELDPSEVTATLLMSKFVEEYLKQAKTSVADLLDAPDDHIETLRKAKRLRELLSTPDIVKAREVFLLGLKAALARYGAAEREDVQKLLDNPASVAVLRRDALRSLNAAAGRPVPGRRQRGGRLQADLRQRDPPLVEHQLAVEGHDDHAVWRVAEPDPRSARLRQLLRLRDPQWRQPVRPDGCARALAPAPGPDVSQARPRSRPPSATQLVPL
jgi:hypothetical protein